MFNLSARIGSNFLKLKTNIVRDGFTSSLKTLKRKLENVTSPVGVGNTVTAVRNASGTTAHNQKNGIETKKVLNIKELVRNKAIKAYKIATQGTNADDIEFDWSDVQIINTPITYDSKKKIEDVAGTGTVFSKTVFKNNSDVEQQHTLKRESQTSFSCSICIDEGFTSECAIGVYLKPPIDLLKLGLFGDLSIKDEKTTENVKSEKEQWCSENYIKVPKQSSVNVSWDITHGQHDYNFTTWIGVVGTVIATVHDPKHNNTYRYRVPTKTIIVEEFPKDMKKIENGVYYIKFEGSCTFQYALEQNITIN